MNRKLAPLVVALLGTITGTATAQSALRPMDPGALNQGGGAAKTEPAPMAAPVAPGQGPLKPLRPLDLATSVHALGATSAQTSALSSALPPGQNLSEALERYVRERGWSLRWNIGEDYVLDASLPIPSSDLIEGVTWVVNTYQSQGGMLGVVPRFARSNRVVVIEKMDVRDSH